MTTARTRPPGPGWMLDELASAGRENLDAVHAARYDAKEDAAARRCARVVAVDVSPVMLERLRAKVTARALSNVEAVQAGFLSYQHRGPPADVVYSRYALHHLPDLWKALALHRIRDILKPGGLLRLVDVIYDFGPQEAETRIEAWCATGGSAADEADGWSRAELEEHVRDEHSTFRWLFEPTLERCGFAIEQVEYSPDGFFGKYVARARSHGA